jgi:hypothetical protein
MAAGEHHPDDLLSAAELDRLRTLSALLGATRTRSGMRALAGAMGELLAGRDPPVPEPAAVELRVELATDEELRARVEAAGEPVDPEAEARGAAGRQRIDPRVRDRLPSLEQQILRRAAEDPEWAEAFALAPLAALERLEPPPDADVIAALRATDGGPEEALRMLDRVRVAGAGRSPAR